MASDGVESPVAVLAYHVWQSRFAGDPAVLGRSVTLNQRRFTVVGVTPKGFTGVYAGGSRDLWIATGVYDGWSAGDGYDLVGRLVAGRTVAEVQAELNVLANVARSPASARVERARVTRGVDCRRATERRAPVRSRAGDAHATAALRRRRLPSAHRVRQPRRPAARPERSAPPRDGRARVARCHARAAATSALDREPASLNRWCRGVAARGRLGRQAHRDALLLSLRALRGRLRLARAGFHAGYRPRERIAFGIAPALDSSRVEPFGSLQAEGARRTTGRSSLRTAFLIGQVALSVALLVGALVMVQSLGNLVDRPGYAQDEIAHYRLRPSRVKYDANRAAVYYGELTRRLAQVPGVRAVVYAGFPPVRGWGATSAVRVLADGGPGPLVESVRNEVSPGFFRELGIAIAEAASSTRKTVRARRKLPSSTSR